MVTHAKHLAPRENVAKRCFKRYAKAHKPWKVAVTVCFFLVDLIALYMHAEEMVHVGIGATVTTWETFVTTLGE